jgi:hypothetical protein
MDPPPRLEAPGVRRTVRSFSVIRSATVPVRRRALWAGDAGAVRSLMDARRGEAGVGVRLVLGPGL